MACITCAGVTPPDFSWTFGSFLLSQKSQSPKDQDILFSITYAHVVTPIFSRHAYPLLFMEKAGKSFRKIPRKTEKEIKETAVKLSHVYGTGSWELASERAPATCAGMEGLQSKQVGQVAAEFIYDPC